MEIIKRLCRLMAPYKRQIFRALCLQLVVIASRMVVPILTRTVIDDVIPHQNLDLLVKVCGVLIALVAARGVCSYVRGLIFEKTSQDVVYDLRTGLYAHLQELPYPFYDNHRIGEIMSRMTGDIEGVRNLISNGITTVFDNALNFVGALIFLSFMSWQLMLSLLIFAPILALVAWMFRKKIFPAFAATHEQNAVLNTRTQENIAGMRVVKAFAREPHEYEGFVKDNRKLLDCHLRATRIWSDFVPLMELLSALCTPVMLLFGSALVLNGCIGLGTLIAVNGYVWLITNPMRMLANIVNMLTQAVASAEKLFYYVDFGSSIREKPNARQPDEYAGKVEFEHVDFAYGSENVLTDITFSVEPGQTVAIMGATGAGKSSLILLLGRYYDIHAGSVKIDGIDVRDHKLKPLRQSIAYVMQETFLFSDTIEDNIRFGRPNAKREDVESAADAARASEFIEHMPARYETIVGERGLGLSGGQKQRVAIARALITQPSILVMDDSTSAVDMETEYIIQQKLKAINKKRTTFIIAHRISSVKHADMILVLENGRIAERGTHKELIHKRGIYYGMVADQYGDMATAAGISLLGKEATANG